jgi:hypothetical protein
MKACHCTFIQFTISKYLACRTVTRLRPRNKQVPTATSSRATTEEVLETDFSTRSVPRCYKEDNWSKSLKTRVEAGSNISTVTLRVVGGDEKGSLESETVKYSRKSHGTWTLE